MTKLDTRGLRLAAVFFWLGLPICLVGLIPMSLHYWDTYAIVRTFSQHLLFSDQEYLATAIGFYCMTIGFFFSYGYRAGVGRVVNWVKG